MINPNKGMVSLYWRGYLLSSSSFSKELHLRVFLEKHGVQLLKNETITVNLHATIFTYPTFPNSSFNLSNTQSVIFGRPAASRSGIQIPTSIPPPSLRIAASTSILCCLFPHFFYQSFFSFPLKTHIF